MLEGLLSYKISEGVVLGDLIAPETLVKLGGSVLGALGIVFAGYVVAGWASRRIRKIGAKYARLDDTLFNFLSNIVRYAIIVFAVMFTLNTYGVQTTSMVAVIGSAGLAIGLALQGTLSNVAAGVMIVIFRPFKLGDFVEVGGTSGTVKDISLNFTELASPANVQVIVPNGQIWGNVITNFSANTTRRAEWIFGVGYGADLKKTEETIRATIMADPRSMTDPAPFIQVNNLGDFSVDFLVRVWVQSSDFFQYQADMKRKVKEALDSEGIEIPFPTRTVINAADA